MAAVPTRKTLVWIDAREATVVRWAEGPGRENGPRITHHALDVPPHEKSVGRVRHDPQRHGGGRDQSAIETHRLEHLRQGIAAVVAAVPLGEDVLIVGPGPIREHLAAALRDADEKSKRSRQVQVAPAGRLTEPQLVARLRELIGEPRPRVR